MHLVERHALDNGVARVGARGEDDVVLFGKFIKVLDEAEQVRGAPEVGVCRGDVGAQGEGAVTAAVDGGYGLGDGGQVEGFAAFALVVLPC